jgi:ParB family chromosome partitioning protein
MNEIVKTKRTDILLVDPRNIIVREGFNLRVDMGDIEALSASIVENGLEVPIKASKVRGEDSYTLIDGHRRMAAILLAISNGHEIKYVDVLPYKGSSEDELFSMIITGTGQKSLTDIEQAEGIKRLVNYKYSVEEIAKKIAKSIPQIYNLLALSKVSKEIKNKIQDGLISGNTVVQIIKQVKAPAKQLEVVTQAIADAKASTPVGKAPKKATAQNVKALKNKTFKQKFLEALSTLDKDGVDNEKTTLLMNVYNALNDGSVEELVKLCK